MTSAENALPPPQRKLNTLFHVPGCSLEHRHLQELVDTEFTGQPVTGFNLTRHFPVLLFEGKSTVRHTSSNVERFEGEHYTETQRYMY